MKLAATNIRELKPSDIRIDGGTQVRVRLDDGTVAEYRELMEAYVDFPPVVVFFDGSTYWLADGFHRYHAFKRTGREKMPCDVRMGDLRDAILFAVGANSEHGLRRNNEDKRNAVKMILADDEWRGKADNWIAEKCGVTQPFTGKVRKELITVIGSDPRQPRLGRDGKLRRPPEAKAPKSTSQTAHPTCADKPRVVPGMKKPEPNIIGGLKSRLESFLGELVEGQPARVCMAIADHLELLAQDLRK